MDHDTRYAEPVPTRTLAELQERMRRAVRSQYNALVLCEDPRAAADCARLLTADLAHVPMPGGGHSGPALGIDASGMGVLALCSAVYDALALALGWPPAPAPFQTLFDEFHEGMNGLALMREASALLAQMLRPDGRPARRRPALPTIVLWGVGDGSAWVFASWRDELWGVQSPWVICAPFAQKNRYLLAHSDSFFFGGGIHRLKPRAVGAGSGATVKAWTMSAITQSLI